MAQTALQLAAQVAGRVRDPQMTGTIEATYFDLLSRGQVLINAALESVLYTVPFTVLARQQVYGIDGDIGLACDTAHQPRPVRVIGVRDGTRDLTRIPFEGLAHLNREWWAEVGDELRSFALFGHDTLIVRPMLSAPTSVNIVYVGQTPKLAVEGDTTALPDEDTDALLDLVEVMARIKGRDFVGLKEVFERLSGRIAKTAAEVR